MWNFKNTKMKLKSVHAAMAKETILLAPIEKVDLKPVIDTCMVNALYNVPLLVQGARTPDGRMFLVTGVPELLATDMFRAGQLEVNHSIDFPFDGEGRGFADLDDEFLSQFDSLPVFCMICEVDSEDELQEVARVLMALQQMKGLE